MSSVRKVLLISFILIASILGGGLVYLYFNQDKIITAVVEEINSIIDVEAKVESIKLDVFEHWPYVSVQLQNTSIRGANCGIKEQLLETRELSVLINPLSLLKGNFEIQRIHIADGSINIYSSRICDNYRILKDSESGSGTFNLESIGLSNVSVRYFSQENLDEYIFLAQKATISGQISSGQIDAEHRGTWMSKKIKSGGFRFDEEEKLDLIHLLKWNSDEESLLIENLNSELFNARVNAMIHFDFEQHLTNMIFEVGNLDFVHVTQFLNEESRDFVKKFEMEGILSGTVSFYGDYNKDISASVEVATENFGMNFNDYDQVVRITELSGKWDIPILSNWKNSTIHISQLKGSNNDSGFQVSLELNNLNSPYLKGQLFTSQKASFVAEILKLPLKEDVLGTLDIDLSYEGLIPKAKKSLPSNTNLSGIITLNNLGFTGLQPEVGISQLNGQLVFDKKILTIQALQGIIHNSNFQVNGRVENVMEYFYSRNTPLLINTEISSDFINLKDWLSDSDKEEEYELALPDRIIQSHNLKIKKLSLDRFNAKNISGILSLRNNQLKINSMKMEVAGGNVSMDMDINEIGENRVEWFTTGNLKNVFIDSVFYIFRDFNQSFIQQRHLEGQIDADFTGFMVSDDHLNFRHDKHIFSINSRIKNGRLIFFEPLQAVARFIREDDLMNLRFEDLENEIFIKDEIINIPKMDIHSNVRTIKVQGTHTFDNVIDYRFEVPVTAEKADKDERFGRIKDENTGKTHLLLKLTGTADDYKVSYDKDALRENVKTGIKKEMDELKKTLKNKKESEEEEAEIDEDEYFDFN